MTGLAGNPRAAGGFGQDATIASRPMISGRYYDVETTVSMSGPSTTAHTMVANRLYAQMLLLPPGRYTNVGVNIGTAGAAGKLIRSGIYRVGSDGHPGDLWIDGGGNLAADTTGTKEHTISLFLAVPTYLYVATWSDGTPVLMGYSGCTQAPNGWTSATTVSRFPTIIVDGTFGALPSPFGTPTYSSATHPRIWMRG